MHRLHYTGESFLVADEVCRAVLNYASALADAGRSDVVSIPIIDDAGVLAEADLLVGPASQLYSSNVENMREEGMDVALVNDLQGRTERVRTGEMPLAAPPA